MRIPLFLTLLALSACVVPENYSRPQTTSQEFNRDLNQCLAEASAVAGMQGGWTGLAMKMDAKHRCMVGRGYACTNCSE